ncbi:MAG: hypothetical protein R6W83_05830 [Cryobacterium sp.]
MVSVSVLSELLIVLASMGLASVLTVGVIVALVTRRIRRNRALAGAMLRTRALVKSGPQRTVLKLRVRLNESLDSAQAAVDLAVRSEGPRGELPQLLRRIHREGTALESQLRLMETEPDAATLAATLALATDRVDEVTGMVRRLRAAVSSGLGHLSDDSLRTLRGDVDREVVALNAGVQELRALSGDDLGSRRQPASMDNLHRENKS